MSVFRVLLTGTDLVRSWWQVKLILTGQLAKMKRGVI
jgi:hypothetical protein